MASLERDQLWQRARQAQARLTTMLINHPDVRLIELATGADQTPVICVHVRPAAQVPVPDQVAGIPVRVQTGDYRAE